jgi:hypothetical protein
MAVSASTRSQRSLRVAADAGRSLLAIDVLAVIGAVAFALVLILPTYANHLGAAGTVALGAVATLVLFGACGAALALMLLPPAWGALVPLFAVPIGSASGSLALTALGLAHVPLHVTLWLVLAAGVALLIVLLRRDRARAVAWRAGGLRMLWAWLAVLFVVFCVAMIPAWRSGDATVYGENPDSHQVVGIAVLFQHVPPTGTDVALPIDTVPPSWRFRYPIFYPLAGASNLVHMDPIRLFGSMAAVLVLIAALGFGAFAVTCLRAPPGAGPFVAGGVGLLVINLHLAWHPYWNQLWGLAVMPYVLLFGWKALERLDGRLAIAWAVMVVMLALAYPLALPDPLVILAAVAVAYRRWPRPIAMLRSRSWVFAVLGVLVLAPAVAGAALKLEQGISQLLSGGVLWEGDVPHLLPVGRFVGTGGGIVPALAVAAVALLGLRMVPRRVGWAVGLGIVVLVLVDVRVRLNSTGAYMDFKQLSFVGALVVALAAAGVAGLLAGDAAALPGTPPRWHLAAAGAAALATLGWGAAAVAQDRTEIKQTRPQVTPELLQIRSWAARLPRGASVRVDIPPSGTQLWAVYMLGSHPVDSPTPVVYTTYAHAPYGLRADYSIALRLYPVPGPDGRFRRFPRPLYARNPPLFKNNQFLLRRIVWPARLGSTPQTASQTLVEP